MVLVVPEGVVLPVKDLLTRVAVEMEAVAEVDPEKNLVIFLVNVPTAVMEPTRSLTDFLTTLPVAVSEPETPLRIPLAILPATVMLPEAR